MYDLKTIPLFPLQSVLFPGGRLKLRIFEPRYLTMISNCMRENKGFGVCAIRSGRETGDPANCFDVGTFARVVDFDKNEDGMLTITIVGGKRFKIADTETLPDRLLLGRVSWLPDIPVVPLLPEYQSLASLLKQVLRQTEMQYPPDEQKFREMDWVVSRLVELLPFALSDKQRVLETDLPDTRLRILYDELLSEVLEKSEIS